MKGFAIRVWIPVESLGRIRLPRTMKYQDGYVRLGWSPDRAHVVASLEDREGMAMRFPTMTDVKAKGRRLAWAVLIRLMEHNHYEPGEDPGRREQIRMAMA